MIRKTIMGVTAAAMLSVTPTASAGYWTGHAEVIRTIIENWILNHTKGMEGSKSEPNRPIILSCPGCRVSPDVKPLKQ